MKHLLLCLSLLGCEAPSFSFETEGLPCSVPVKVDKTVAEESPKGCYRLTADPDHGMALDDPGLVTCERGSRCVVVTSGQPIWSIGAGRNKPVAEAVDCSETCHANP